MTYTFKNVKKKITQKLIFFYVLSVLGSWVLLVIQ